MRIDEIMKRSLLYFCFLLVSFGTRAQGVFEAGEEPRTVRTNGFWQDWFVRLGIRLYPFPDQVPLQPLQALPVQAEKPLFLRGFYRQNRVEGVQG